ncbi:DUF6153 family protein [Streptomyces coacervatus]|uniref:DUF6153 family protein n=1 Tax=Streptomyces coacervatus TaxID=647381 RepID=A0ABP7GSS4_9ACTN|nr:DUF6153 family protein [Streptomyces coacervatus]MDF2264981.1 DUF6153 family protein [Streptomyces coacervatus]
MTGPEPHVARPRMRRWRGLLVLGLLAGLLGMHALAPGGLAPDRTHGRPTATVVALGDGDCADGHCGGCIVQHADSTCVSRAVGGGPELTAPTPDPAAVAAPADAAFSHLAAAPAGTRASPSLSELQLLRI